MKLTLTILFSFYAFGVYGQALSLPELTTDEKDIINQTFDTDTVFASMVKNQSTAETVYRLYKLNLSQSDSVWEADQNRLRKIADFGYTKKFELIPLIEMLKGNEKFKEGVGVSYLIRTDNSTILFDTGWDDDSTMCAFRYNLDLLGVDISDLDAIIISHDHGDHQNMWKWVSDRTFMNNENENILPEIKTYVPEEKNVMMPEFTYAPDPVRICDGVYTTGIIKAPMFFSNTSEQGLMINVKGKGVVIVTGCGHQTLEKLLARYDLLTDKPLYGVLGGLHYPVYGDAEIYMGYYVTGFLPWERFTVDDVKKNIDLLKPYDIKLVGVSTHDSSPLAISTFKNAYPDSYRDLKTGEWISVK